MQMERYNDLPSLAKYKMLFHCLKYSKSQTTGILLGKVTSGSTEISDVVPLFHTSVLAPSLELAFEMLEVYAKGQEKQIIGVYESQQGNANPPSNLAYELARKIVEVNKVTALCLVIFSKKELGQLKYSFGVNAYELANGSSDFKGVNFKMGIEEEVCKKCIESGASNTIVDFDDHLESCELDWRNTHFRLA
eukprot:TRINITY_DN632_c0_g4_i1.p1 TRINITY_DN632_c0_g4~~TRINITY_DN632_c0_g4_i1.p1  ORF type:complete len:192 (-),score=58.61 TRINITY_DN632_c0_g4_i1:73-648(-)